MSKTPIYTRALQRAFALHQIVPIAEGRNSTNATAKQMADWYEANAARKSLLNDSWPQKNQAFQQFYNAPQPSTIGSPSDDRLRELESIITEEWTEMWLAVFQADMLNVLDGGLDLIYTVINLLLEHGFSPSTIHAAYEEIHASNLTKADDKGKPIRLNGKVQKGPNYVKPNLVSAAAEAVPPQDLSQL